MLALLWLRVVVRAGGRAEQAAGSAREVPRARAWGFRQKYFAGTALGSAHLRRPALVGERPRSLIYGGKTT